MVRLLLGRMCGSAVAVDIIVAEVDLHVLLLLRLSFVGVRGASEDVDLLYLLVDGGVVVEVLIQAAVSALAALGGLLGVVARLVEVVIVDEAGASVDDLAAYDTSRIPRWCSVSSEHHWLVPLLSGIEVGHLDLLLGLLLHLTRRIDRRVVHTGVLHARRPLVGLQLVLPNQGLLVALQLLGPCLGVQAQGGATVWRTLEIV